MEMELLKVGTDAQGDTFTKGCLEQVVKRFKPGSVPITIGFDPRSLPVGSVQSLRLDGDRLMAAINLDAAGTKAVDGGMELASGGTFTIKGEHGTPQVIDEFDLTGAALTDKKVK